MYCGSTRTRPASQEKITEALGVAIEVNAEAAVTYSARVIDSYKIKAKS
ncbi:carboxymuconolactone decarboxylase family protein [Leptospira broomii serovar Hurstbridge str. 5399]|uniref:Carboxymuconolactone decarboxylase family protein n=1 Tax=Leptospira broomii serovar Hurstbridge str. 5399 TaxID=1049789 RepID=T0F7B1_9LEPT|nr:carboxymuconolactone decarboxylase family protein [Leptospira broomii serovar Hurstbridge str. 5399]